MLFFHNEFSPFFQEDELILTRLFAHNFLGPRIYASFSNGIAYEYVSGRCLDYDLAVDRNVYPLVAQKGMIQVYQMYQEI